MINIPLTASQIKTVDEISLDRQAIKETLEVALNFHSNRLNGFRKKEKEFWDDLAKTHNLDVHKSWKLTNSDGSVCIVEKKDKQ